MGDSTVRCPRCKTTVAAERARGLRGICPRCLFEALIAPDDEAARSPLELLEGTELGNYTVLGLVGSGGMGVVYRARQKGLDRVVALKILNPRGTAGREEVERFFREARAAARLQHPNIVAIHEVGSASGYYFFTMDYVEGRTLHDFIEDHPLDARTAATLLAKVARAVHYAHEQGIIHRDLKPANILVDRDGEPRVMDFGLAKEIASESRLTQSGVVMGTPSYMSPEQARGEPLDGRTDVYSLGAVLYEALTGLPPFRGRDPATVLRQVLEVEPMPPRRLRADTPRDLETICLKALEKERERRYTTAAELADDLERFLRGEAVRARRAGPVYRARRWIARHAAVAALALLAFGFAGAFVWTATRPRVGSMANGPSTTPPSVPSDEGILAVRRAVDAARRKIEAAEAMTAEDALARRVAFLQEALARLDEVAANGRACADWAYWRGRALLALHRHEEAVTEFTRAVLADPHHTDARYGRLRAHMELIALGAMVQQLPNAYRVRAVRADRDALRDAGAPADIVATADASVAALDAIGAILPARDDRRLDEAVARLRRHADEARAQNPTNPLAPFLEAFVAVLASPDDRSGLETLLALVDAALDRHPGDVFYLSARAWTLARLGRPADATAAADRLEAIAPESTLAPLCRAWICAGSGDVFGAEKALRQARGRQTHIEFIAPMDLAPLAPAGGADLAGEGFAGMDDEGLVGGPATDWRSLEQNVIASARIGDMASALDGLAQLASGGWNNWYVLESDPKAQAFALLPEYCEIKSWFALNPQEAAARVRHALDVAGKALAAAESLRTADDIARRDSFLTQALSSLDEAVRTDSSVAEIHYLRGRALRLLQRRGEATDALTRAILADPNHARARYLRAMVTAEELMDTSDVLGEPDPAALARLREDADWLEAHGAPADHVLVARGFERLAATLPAMLVPVDRPGHPEVPADEIRECAQRALEENPTNPHAYVVAAYAEWGREGHELSRPIEMLRRALEYAPTDVWIAQRLGRVLVASGRLQEAADLAHRMIRMSPETYDGHLILGMVRALSGRREEADEQFARARRLSDHPAFVEFVRGLAVSGLIGSREGWADLRKDPARREGFVQAMSAAIDLDPSLALAYLLRGNVRLQSGDCGGAEDLVCAAALSPALGELLGGNLALERMRQVFDHGSGAHRNMQAWARRWNAGNRPGDRIQALEGLVRNFARQGNRSAALRHLARLVDMDWAGWDRLEADPSLKSLWSDPEYVEMQRRYYARQTQAVAQARERLGDLLRRMDTMPRMEESPGQWQEFLQEFGDAVEDIRVRVAGMEEADSVWMRLQNRAGNWWATVETGRQMRMRQSAESAPGDTIAAYVRALVASSIEQYAALGGWVGADDPGPQVAGEIRDALMAWRDAAAGTASAERLEAAARSLGREWQDLAQLLGAEASILRGQSAFALDDGIPEARVVRLHAGLDALARGRLEDARNQLSALERSAPGWYGTELLGAALDQETGRPDDAVSRRLRRGVEMACGNPAARALAARIAGRLTSGLFDLRSLPQDRFDLALDLLASGAVRESIFIEFSAGDEPVVTFTAAGSSFADVAYWNVRGLLRLLSGRDPSGGRMDLERFLRTTESGPATDRVRAALGDLVEVRRPFLARTAAEMGAHAWSLIHRSREDAAEVAEYLEPWAAQLRAMPDGHERAEWLREVWFAVAGGRARSGDTPKALRALSLLVETGWNDWGRFEQESAFDSVRHHPRVGPLRRRSGDY